MTPLMTARIGATVQNAFVVATNANGTAPGRSRINWPWGRIEVHEDRLDLKLVFSSFSIPLDDVERIERHMVFLVRMCASTTGVRASRPTWPSGAGTSCPDSRARPANIACACRWRPEFCRGGRASSVAATRRMPAAAIGPQARGSSRWSSSGPEGRRKRGNRNSQRPINGGQFTLRAAGAGLGLAHEARESRLAVATPAQRGRVVPSPVPSTMSLPRP